MRKYYLAHTDEMDVLLVEEVEDNGFQDMEESVSKLAMDYPDVNYFYVQKTRQSLYYWAERDTNGVLCVDKATHELGPIGEAQITALAEKFPETIYFEIEGAFE